LVLAHLVLDLLGGVGERPELYALLGLSREGILQGRVWQFATHAFLHGNWGHLAGNVALVYLMGAIVHRVLGGRWFLGVFWAGVALGGGMHVLLHPGQIPVAQGVIRASGPLVGASGGAMALLVAVTVLAPDSRLWPIPVTGKNFALGVMLAALLLYLLTPTLGIPGFAAMGWAIVDVGLAGIFQIAHACHFGGGMAGFLLMRWLLRRPVTLADLQKERARKEGSIAA
jgi:membrane associated rhomboid family serine protease